MLEVVRAPDETEIAPSYIAYHVLVIDHVLVTLITDRDGNVAECRVDVVAEANEEVGMQISSESIGALESGTVAFSSKGFDARSGMDDAVSFLEDAVVKEMAREFADFVEVQHGAVNSVRPIEAAKQAG